MCEVLEPGRLRCACAWTPGGCDEQIEVPAGSPKVLLDLFPHHFILQLGCALRSLGFRFGGFCASALAGVAMGFESQWKREEAAS